MINFESEHMKILASDKYLLFEKDIKPRIGFSVLDEAREMARPLIPRIYELVSDAEQQSRKSPPGVLLCPGASVGLDKDGHVLHFHPGLDLTWLGFVTAIGDARVVSVKVRGSVKLFLPGAKRGDSVFCSGPDTFSLSSSPGCAQIGVVKYVQEGDRAAVAFKHAGDSRPLNLD